MTVDASLIQSGEQNQHKMVYVDVIPKKTIKGGRIHPPKFKSNT